MVALAVAPATKRCPVCKRTLPADSFPRSAGSRDGLYRRCKPCNNRVVRDWKREQRRVLLAYRAALPGLGKDGEL